MAISYVDSTTNGASSGIAVSVTKPTGLAVNDVVIVVVHANGPRNSSDNNGAAPFTAILTNREYNGPSAQVDIYYRVIDGTEGSTFNFTLDGSDRWSIIASAYRGVDINDVFDIPPTTTTENTGTGSTNTTDPLTTTVDGAMIVALAVVDSATISFTATPGSSFNSRQNNSGEQLLALADKLIVTATTQAAVSWTQSGSSGTWLNNIFSLNPATTPYISTIGATDIDITGLTLQARISAIGGDTVTRRGFQFNTVPSSDREVYEDGSFLLGYFTLDVTDLAPNTTYYFRAFATNSSGTAYGSWLSVTTLPSQYAIVIGSITRTSDVLNQTISIEDTINDQQNTLTLALMDLSGNGIPDTDDEVTITLEDGTLLFGGYIVKVDLSKMGNGDVVAIIRAVDYVRLFDRNLVHQTYEDMTDKEIIESIVTNYCAGSGITTNNVVEGVTVDQISFNYLQPSQCLRKIVDLTGRNWYIDYEKDIHYFPTTTTETPFNIDENSDEYFNLKIQKDASQLKNRVYVRGGTRLSDFTSYSEKGDGEKRQFVLPDKPHDVSVTVNGASKSLGIKNINLTGYDFYLNFQEKYVEQDSGGAVLTTSDTLEVTYKYDIPILVAQENSASIAEHGTQEFAIFDKTITTTESARARALAELTDYANNIIEGSFETYAHGFKSGQYINIDLDDYDIDADYIVQKVIARSLGSGLYTYQIYLASAKTMGIIRFLIELLEANRNLIELDDNEVIDELLSLSDSLLSDSLTELLTIDSAGPYRTWAIDSLEITSTRIVWNLFEWGKV